MKKKELMINGIRISYLENLENLEKPVTLFLHGWGSSKESFHLLFPYFENLIAFDFPGMGDSQEFHTSADVSDFVAVFNEFFQKTIGKRKCNIIVHSFGGRVLLQWLNCNKNYRFESIVCIGVPFYRNLSALGKIQLQLGKILQNKIFSCIKPFITKLYGILNPQSDYINISDGKIKKTFQSIVSQDISVFLPELKKQNVLFIWGENDTSAPISNMMDAKRIVTNAEIISVKNAGHFPWVDNINDFLLGLGMTK